MYEFNAAHSVCTRAADNDDKEYQYHQVSVMEMPSAIGTGDTLEEATAAASEALACVIERMQDENETIPSPYTMDQVRIKAVEASATKHPWLDETTRFISIVHLKPAKLPEKTQEELQALELEGRRIWDEVCSQRLEV